MNLVDGLGIYFKFRNLLQNRIDQRNIDKCLHLQR